MKHALAGAVLIANLLGVGPFVAVAPALAQDAAQDMAQDTPQEAPAQKCYDCPKPRDHYDSVETVHTTKDVDQSRVINTQSEVVVGRRLKETNHLIIRDNETRNVGVIQHNHTIYEVTPRYVVRVPKVTVVSYVTQRYYVVETPATMTVPVSTRPASRCSRGGRYDRYSRYDASCRRVLRVRG